MTSIRLQSAKQIFTKRFYGLELAAIQKLEDKEKNTTLLASNLTGDWPALRPETDVLALVFMRGREREFWVGRLVDQRPSPRYLNDKLYEFEVDRFELMGTHHLDEVPDAEFYRTGGGGGARVYVQNDGTVVGQKTVNRPEIANAPGEEVKRLVWMRRNHHLFRDAVWRKWESRCAVTQLPCNGLLVASHIFPWSRSTPEQKTDVNNGLLLSSPWDVMFDRGLIGFDDDGALLVSSKLARETQRVFGVTNRAKLAMKPSPAMRIYLRMHRELYEL